MFIETAPSLGIAARLRGVSHEYGRPPNNLAVLDEVDLEIRAGRLTLLMGPSGSGKTTLLTILGLLRRPTRGRVEVGGRDLSDCTEAEWTAIRRREVGFIFQNSNLLTALTAQENVQVVLDLQGQSQRDAASGAMGLLKRVGLADRAEHRPGELSGGQQQRVAIARALASPGSLILADEPTASLDSRSAKTVMALLRELADRDGRAVVVVTHDPRLEPVADDVIRIEDGRIVDCGGGQ